MMYNIHDSAVHVGNVEAHGGAEVGKHEQVERRAGHQLRRAGRRHNLLNKKYVFFYNHKFPLRNTNIAFMAVNFSADLVVDLVLDRHLTRVLN